MPVLFQIECYSQIIQLVLDRRRWISALYDAAGTLQFPQCGKINISILFYSILLFSCAAVKLRSQLLLVVKDEKSKKHQE